MKQTIIFISAICLLAVVSFFAGVKYSEVNQTKNAYDQSVLTQEALRSYQIEISEDNKSFIIYDGDRKVGVLPVTETDSLTHLIDADNE